MQVEVSNELGTVLKAADLKSVKKQTRRRAVSKPNRVAALVEELLRELGVTLDGSAGAKLRSAMKAIPRSIRQQKSGISVTALCDAYMKFAKTYYRRPKCDEVFEAIAIGYALAPLRTAFGSTQANDFGPRSLKAVREEMILRGWCRNQVNMQVNRVKRMFKWAVSNEMVVADVLHALQSVDGLRAGRSAAPESKPVKPVPEALIEAVLPKVSSPVSAMIRLQLLTGMRPGEVTIMRTCDIDRSKDPWHYRPEHHKTEQHGHERFVLLGPKAKEILQPFLNDESPKKYLFCPRFTDYERREKLHASRKTPMSCGNIPGSNRKARPKRKPGDRYGTQAYGNAIKYGCRGAFPPPKDLEGDKLKDWRRSHHWHPHQLRHNAATRLRKDFGLDVAQVVLGHKTLVMTQVYAEKNVDAAAKVMLNVG